MTNSDNAYAEIDTEVRCVIKNQWVDKWAKNVQEYASRGYFLQIIFGINYLDM